MSQTLKSFVALALALSFGVAAIFGQTTVHGYDRSNMDTGAQACTDFYQYASGGWLQNNPIPAAYSAWGVDNPLAERNSGTLRPSLETAAKKTKPPTRRQQPKVRGLLRSCND